MHNVDNVLENKGFASVTPLFASGTARFVSMHHIAHPMIISCLAFAASIMHAILGPMGSGSKRMRGKEGKGNRTFKNGKVISDTSVYTKDQRIT